VAREWRGSTLLGSYRITHSNPTERFKQYLQSTREYRLRLKGTNKDCEVTVIVPYIHRKIEIYHKSILAKFYKLDEWMREFPGIVTLFTLTTYQGSKSRYHDGSYSQKMLGHDLTLPECFNLLKYSRAKLLNVLRNRYPGINYVWVLEPHKTGFPHCHLVEFRKFSEPEQIFIKQLWSSKYRAGSFDRGIDITSKTSFESIQSIRNYLMKYMTKQFGYGEDPWTKEELEFNAMVWRTGTRMYGASKELTLIMRRPEKKSDITWNTVDLLTRYGEFEVWSREDGKPFPVLGHQLEPEPDPDDLCPEGGVTKQLWKNIYGGINQWRTELEYQ